MMNKATVLGKHGIQRPKDVVELAARAGLELAAAATLLEKESSGGHNVYGHDDVRTGGFYEKGGPVTRANYAKYKAHRHEFGAQGVGPTQLTFPPFQDRADARGGADDWRINALVGFEILAGLVSANGSRGGFRRYNGSGDAAEAYADDAMKKLEVWRSRLGKREQERPTGGRKPGGAHRDTAPAGNPILRRGSTGSSVSQLQRCLNRVQHSRLAVDGDFGPKTTSGVMSFQDRAGGLVVDGEYGPKTATKLAADRKRLG
jgi:hypothetical protein